MWGCEGDAVEIKVVLGRNKAISFPMFTPRAERGECSRASLWLLQPPPQDSAWCHPGNITPVWAASDDGDAVPRPGTWSQCGAGFGSGSSAAKPCTLCHPRSWQ